MNKKNLSINFSCFFIWLIILPFYSCDGQKKSLNDCKSSWQTAKELLDSYYLDHNELLLWQALNNTEEALQCEETARKAVEQKITLLMLLKESRRGVVFVDSLDEKTFKFPYQKKMSRTFFLEIDKKSNDDSLQIIKSYHDVATGIQKFLDNSSRSNFNKEVYYDLFYIKSKILSQEKLMASIDSITKKYPQERDFFEALKNSFSDDSQNSYPTIKQ